jgi:hypothetical protein
MHITRALIPVLAAALIFNAGLAGLRAAPAASMPAKAVSKGLLGNAQFSRAGGPFQAVSPGVLFEAGDVIQTAAGAALDLDFGSELGTVRLTELTTLVIEKWQGTGPGYELNLFLRDGEMLGRVTHPMIPSRFQIKVNTGVGAIVEGQFRLNAKGYLVLLDGKGAYVHAPFGGEPVAHSLTAPPQYFSPSSGGVRPAPPELVKEVNSQWRSKLPKR